MKRREFIKTTLGSVFLGNMGCSLNTVPSYGKQKNKRPNILWIMMDDCRADAVGCYGRGWVKTPNMDAIAQQGTRFQTAIVQNPVCVPSRTSMKTGRYPHEFGIMAMGKPPTIPEPYINQHKIDTINKTPTLLDHWKQIGIPTVNVGKIHAFRDVWTRRGEKQALIDVFGNTREKKDQKRFEQFSQNNPHPTVKTKTHQWMIGGVVPVEPEETQTWRLGDIAVKTLGELSASDKPFFLRVSFHAPHVPCRVPKSYMIDPKTINLPLPDETELKSKPRFERECLQVYAGGLDLNREQIDTCRGTYYGMVSLVDDQVGRLVEVLKKTGKLKNTIIAINADQGFQLGEHGLWKKRVFYEQNVCVPFIISCPRLLPANKVIDEPVEMVDFLPTLMDLSDLKPPDSIRGRSLMPLIRGEVKKWREACFCEIDHSRSMYDELRRGTGRRVMVRTKEWKLIFFMDKRVADKDGALYNLIKDPDEKENLYSKPKYKNIVKHLEGLAEDWDKKI